MNLSLLKGSLKITHRHFFAAAAATLLAAATFTLTNSAKPQPVQANAMRTWVRKTLSRNKVRGSVLVIKNGQPQTISYGYAWYGKRIGNGNDKVVYPTCSLQKVVTAAMMVQLINETVHSSNPINQYSKISRWYPNLKNADKITLGELMSHTSGFTLTGTEGNRGINYSEDGAYNWMVKELNKTAEFAPGNYFYNNANYVLLAGIIKKATGRSYQDNFNQRIVSALGLKATYLYPDIPKSKTDPISYTYSYRDANYVKRTVASQLPGAANMFTTPREYFKIIKGLSNGQILSKSDFHYLTHLKSKVTDYCGGVYTKKNDSLISAYGNLHNTHFGNWFQITSDNQNGMIMFLNQTNGSENQQKDIGYQILNHIKAHTFTNR